MWESFKIQHSCCDNQLHTGMCGWKHFAWCRFLFSHRGNCHRESFRRLEVWENFFWYVPPFKMGFYSYIWHSFYFRPEHVVASNHDLHMLWLTGSLIFLFYLEAKEKEILGKPSIPKWQRKMSNWRNGWVGGFWKGVSCRYAVATSTLFPEVKNKPWRYHRQVDGSKHNVNFTFCLLTLDGSP